MLDGLYHIQGSNRITDLGTKADVYSMPVHSIHSGV